jgi:hypothetical protein
LVELAVVHQLERGVFFLFLRVFLDDDSVRD